VPLLVVGRPPSASAAEKLRISYQPANWGVVFYAAVKEGFFKEVGLDTKSSVFQSGAPQVAAGASGAWDIGGGGDLPSLAGGARYGLLTVAFADTESRGNVLIATAGLAKKAAADPKALKGQVVVWPTNSTGQWVGQTCLRKKFGLSDSEYRAINLSPGAINNALSSGKYHLAGTFDPFDFLLSAKVPAKVICTGEDVGIHVTSNLFVTPEYAKAHPGAVAKFLAVYLHTVEWEKSHPKKFYKLAGQFYAANGLKLAPKYVKLSITHRKFLSLSQELSLFQGGDKSKAAEWMRETNEFARSTGVVRKLVDPKSYMTDAYLIRVERTPQLRKFATNGNARF
jgi:NitT/TauT family transport system substrate-binding protein